MKTIVGMFLLLCLSGTVSSEEHKTKKLAGWNVLVSPKIDKAHLDELESTLKHVNTVFPRKFLPIIQRVPIEIDGNGSDPNDEQFERGRYEFTRVVTDGVDKPFGAGKIRVYSTRDCGNRVLFVHELSHAAHNLTIGYDDVRVKQAYQEVVKKDLYPKDCYLMTNHVEYFAEMSVVYLSKLHYFPHDRETLKKHDPTSYQLMEEFWESRMKKR